MKTITKHIRITGRVQGVGFRYFTKKNAGKLNIKGWVKNNTDGSVESILSGTSEDLFRMIEHMRQGPPAARVDTLEELPVDKKETHHEFHIKR